MQGCPILVAESIYISICCDQGARRVDVADVGSVVEGGPAVGVNVVDVGVAVLNDSFEGVWLGILKRENSLVDGSLSKDGLTIINLAATVH